MSYFVVTREAGPGWTDGKGTFEQPAANDHATFMNALADQGSVLFAGPLSGSEAGRIRALLIVDAADEAEIERRLADDPWALTEHLVMVSIEPWNIFVGAERLAAAQLARPSEAASI
jgi:uncharacterized protein YciI